MATRGINKITILGAVSTAPERRLTQSGDPIAVFSVTTTQWGKGRHGQRREIVERHRVVAFKRLADVVARNLRQGQQVYVEGSIKTSTWEDEDGILQREKNIMAQDVIFIGPKSASRAEHRDDGFDDDPDALLGDVDDEEIPF